MINLHDVFGDSEHPGPPEDPDNLIGRCKKLLYAYPTGRHLVDVLNLHHIPVHLKNAERPGYELRNHREIVLINALDISLTEMSFHLACAIRSVELHIQPFLSPEMKDSRASSHANLSEPFEIMLTVCKLAYDMKFSGPNKEVDNFLEKNGSGKIYEAYAHQTPLVQLEKLMLDNFNSRN